MDRTEDHLLKKAMPFVIGTPVLYMYMFRVVYRERKVKNRKPF